MPTPHTDLIIVYAELELGDMALKLHCCILKLRYRIKSWYLEISSRTLHKCRTGWQKSNITIFVTKCFDISINPRRILCTHYWQLFWDTLMRVTWSWARCCFGRMFQEMLEIQQHSTHDQTVIWVLSQPVQLLFTYCESSFFVIVWKCINCVTRLLTNPVRLFS